MVKLINKLTHTPMWVAESRVEEYLAAGHTRPESPKAKPAEVEESEEKPKKATPKKKPATRKR
jgi:hypothetical protein